MNGTIENRFVLDTNAIIFLTTRGNVIPPDLENALNEAALFTSVISEIEVFSKPALPPDEEENLRSFLSEKITIIDLTNDIKKETIALRRSTKLKLPDSIVAAASICHIEGDWVLLYRKSDEKVVFYYTGTHSDRL